MDELVEMMFALELIGIHHEHRQGILLNTVRIINEKELK